MNALVAPLPGALVISFDFELRWGVRDTCPPGAPYERNLHGARAVIPRLLSLLDSYGAAATWATVGFLFAESAEELREFRPSVLPEYRDPGLSPYGDSIGHGETDDPLHFAPSLIERIRTTGRQEIGTHTFSHYYCNEPGQTAHAFAADMNAAVAIAHARGIEVRSIVFPRNQHNPSYDAILMNAGITAYRGNPRSWMWTFSGTRDGRTALKRAGRIVDAYVGAFSDATAAWTDVVQPSGLSNIPAGVFLRPYDPRASIAEPLRLRRIVQALESAARRGRIVHLWTHPHNFGSHADHSLGFLTRILDAFDRLRSAEGMVSLSMAEADRLVRVQGSGAPIASDPGAGAHVVHGKAGGGRQ